MARREGQEGQEEKEVIYLRKSSIGVGAQHHSEHPFHGDVERAGFDHQSSVTYVHGRKEGQHTVRIHDYTHTGSGSAIRLESDQGPDGKKTHSYNLRNFENDMYYGESHPELREDLKHVRPIGKSYVRVTDDGYRLDKSGGPRGARIRPLGDSKKLQRNLAFSQWSQFIRPHGTTMPKAPAASAAPKAALPSAPSAPSAPAPPAAPAAMAKPIKPKVLKSCARCDADADTIVMANVGGNRSLAVGMCKECKP